MKKFVLVPAEMWPKLWSARASQILTEMTAAGTDPAKVAAVQADAAAHNAIHNPPEFEQQG